MKYQNLLLSFSLAAAVSFGTALCAQAKLTPEQQAKAAAEAKAKADREMKQKLWHEFRTIRGEAHKLASYKEFAKIAPYCEKMLVYFDKIAKFGPLSQNELREFETIAHIYRWNWKDYKTETKRFYEEIIKRADGDVCVGWIEMYAQFLKEQKISPQEDINKVLASRYQVKGISNMRLIRLQISDNKLEDADAAIMKLVAAESDPVKKIGIYRQFVKDFQNKKVYGSSFLNKYYKDMMKLVSAPDDKSKLMREYASFAEQYAILSMDEVDKLYAESIKIPGLSSKYLVEYYGNQVARTNDSATVKGNFDKGMAIAGDDFALRSKMVSSVLSLGGYHAVVRFQNLPWFPAIFEKEVKGNVAISQTDYRWKLEAYLNGYANSGKLAEVEKMLQRFIAEDLKIKKNAAADHAKKLAAVEAIRQEREKNQLNIQELNKQISAEKDNAKRAALNKRATELREKGKELNSAWDTANRAERGANEFARKTDDRLSYAYNVLANCYKNMARRYMESSDPVFLRKAVGVQKQRIANVTAVHSKLDACNEIMNLALTIRDTAQADQIHAEAKALIEKEIAAAEKRNDKGAVGRMLDRLNVMAYPIAFLAYHNEDYAKAVELMLPLTKNPNRNYAANLYEYLVRSYVALGKYEDALKFTDKMVEHAPWYMRNRYKQMISELKERMADAAK